MIPRFSLSGEYTISRIIKGGWQLAGDHGSFRQAYPGYARRVQVHTKFVPDLSDLGSLDRRYVETIIDRSLTRLGQERLDLVQFHWWDFSIPRYVETAFELDRLRRAGKIVDTSIRRRSLMSILSMCILQRIVTCARRRE